MEEASYDSRATRERVGIDLAREPVLDETTIRKLRRLTEKHIPGDQLFHLVNEYLQKGGLNISQGTIVDATIIHAAVTTKNKGKLRVSDMHQTKTVN